MRMKSLWAFIKLWFMPGQNRHSWIWLPVTVIVYRKQELRFRVFIKELVGTALTHQFLYVTCCFVLILPLVWTCCWLLLEATLMVILLTYVFWLSCLLTATSIRPPLGRILARPCSRWTRPPRPVLCQSSNRTWWTQLVVCIYLNLSDFSLTIEAAHDVHYR